MSQESISKLAELTGRTYRTVKNRIKLLTPVKPGKGKAFLYESTEALPLIYDLGEASNPQKEMARYNRVRADRSEFDLAVAKGDVASMEILVWTLTRVAKLINSVLDSLPLRLKKRCPKLNAKDIEFIRRTIVKLQNEISEIQLK